MILGAVTPKNQKDLRSSLHPNTIKPILDMGIDIIFESGLGAGMDVNDEVLTSLGAKSVSGKHAYQNQMYLCQRHQFQSMRFR